MTAANLCCGVEPIYLTIFGCPEPALKGAAHRRTELRTDRFFASVISDELSSLVLRYRFLALRILTILHLVDFAAKNRVKPSHNALVRGYMSGWFLAVRDSVRDCSHLKIPTLRCSDLSSALTPSNCSWRDRYI